MEYNLLLKSDLESVFLRLKNDLGSIAGKRFFITGGTGFIGKWLLESILFINEQTDLKLSVTVLARDPDSFLNEYNYFSRCSAINFIKGDVRDFEFPDDQYDYIIHAATEASAKMNIENPLLMIDVIVNGTKHMLDFAVRCHAKKFLFLSSGAVYGLPEINTECLPENYSGAPDPLVAGSAYGESKRLAELLCAAYSKQNNFIAPIARCFAFVGPYLSLDAHYAIGNFINDGLNGKDIIVKSTGQSMRSYMYSTDLVIWLMVILINSKTTGAYNVGSGEVISIRDLAKLVAEQFPMSNVHVLNQVTAADRNYNYIPDILKTESTFGLTTSVSLSEAICRTILYHNGKKI